MRSSKFCLVGLFAVFMGVIWLSGLGCAHAASDGRVGVPSYYTGRAAASSPESSAPTSASPIAPISPSVSSAPDAVGTAAQGMSAGSSPGEYILGVGDRFRMTVYGEDDLSGEYEVGSTGMAALPLIGNVQAAGLTVRNFEEAVRSKLAEGYLRDPRVSVQVSNYRPFFILGEVSKPGGYPYVNGMTVLNAVALAGGYTYRADKKGITIMHANDPSKTEHPVGEEGIVQPGDVIRVPERFF